MQSTGQPQADEQIGLFRRLAQVAAVLASLAALYLSSVYSYLLFHTLAELFSIVIGFATFVIAWNVRQFLKNEYLLLLGVASLFVAILDLTHTLSYSGMGVFPGYDANLPTQLWLAARILQSVSLLVAPLLLGRSVRMGLLVPVYAVVTAFMLMAIFVWRIFPVCYVEGQGLTAFKRGGEYVVSLILLAAIELLWRRHNAFEPAIWRRLAWSIGLTICSELAFTSYVSVYGFANLLGHLLKIAAMYLVYRAIIQTGLTKPFALLLRETKLAEEELERLVFERTATLQATTDQLHSFVYSIAHDLRAPLRAQQGFANILLEDSGPALSPEMKTCAERIAAAALRMDRLVCDLLAYATVDSRKPALSKVDLAVQVSKARAALEHRILETGASIDSAGVSGVLLADEQSVDVALTQLLDNALKFSREGHSPEIRIWTESRNGVLRVWVADNGIGIDPQYHPKLFGVFQQLHRSSTYAGNGIGLALVKKNIERLGGQVGVESEAGKGSRFWFELPKA